MKRNEKYDLDSGKKIVNIQMIKLQLIELLQKDSVPFQPGDTPKETGSNMCNKWVTCYLSRITYCRGMGWQG